jgi:hypothetical protein
MPRKPPAAQTADGKVEWARWCARAWCGSNNWRRRPVLPAIDREPQRGNPEHRHSARRSKGR